MERNTSYGVTARNSPPILISTYISQLYSCGKVHICSYKLYQGTARYFQKTIPVMCKTLLFRICVAWGSSNFWAGIFSVFKSFRSSNFEDCDSLL